MRQSRSFVVTWVAFACLLNAPPAEAGSIVVTEPLQRYGLGFLQVTAHSPVGEIIATGGGIGVILWDGRTGALIRIISGHDEMVTSVAFSSDGNQVLTGSWDETAKLWDANTGAEIRTFFGHTNTVFSVAFSPDGNWILTGDQDGLTFLWDSGLSPLRTEDKLLIVAGGGLLGANPIINQTKNLADLAHLTATVRGYKPERILYLSSLEDMAENPNIDGIATSAAIEDGIVNWASDASRLIIICLDHGTYNPTLPGWFFLVNESDSSRDTMQASRLNEILDDVQSGPSPLRELILITDFCYSGGFVNQCAGAPEGMERTVISSTTLTRLANFGANKGTLSFTSFFLSSLFRGTTIFDSFQVARAAVVALDVPATAPQLPWLDDDGDGVPSSSDGAVARTGPAANSQSPSAIAFRCKRAR